MTSPPPKSPSVESLTEEFTSIDAYLQAAQEVLEEGHMPCLKGLEERVFHVCLRIQESSLENEVRALCLERLETILSKLDCCKELMDTLQTKKQGLLQ
ncbi:MAG: hypothetical protein PHS57_05680 [Alphaproteobacteria bacterium]|nr:hypothetical protein [Alphaproteobacteria bacterium]